MANVRGPLRATITRLVKQVDDGLAVATPNLGELQIIIAQVEDKYDRLKALDQVALNALNLEDQPHEFEEEFDRIESYTDKVIRARILVQNLEKTMGVNQVQALPSSEGSVSISSGNGNGRESTHPPYASAFRVPEFRLAQFDGKSLLEFPSWYDQFNSLIDSHSGLSACQKLGILRDSLWSLAGCQV